MPRCVLDNNVVTGEFGDNPQSFPTVDLPDNDPRVVAFRTRVVPDADRALAQLQADPVVRVLFALIKDVKGFNNAQAIAWIRAQLP